MSHCYPLSRRERVGVRVLTHTRSMMPMRVLSRRNFLGALAASATLPFPAKAAPGSAGEIVFATWGGGEIPNLTRAFATPFQNAGGPNIVFDGTGPTEGAIRNMVDSGDVSWDVCDADGYSAIRLGRSGSLSSGKATGSMI